MSLDIEKMSFKEISLVDIQLTDNDWAKLMEQRSDTSCKEPMPEWFIEQYKDSLNFAAFSRLVTNHANIFTDEFLKKYSMFLTLRPVLDAVTDSKVDKLKRIFYMGPIQDITMEMLDKDPGYYDRGAWEGFVTFFRGVMPLEFVARHLNRLNIFYIAMNPFILNGYELFKIFSFSAGTSRVIPDGSRVTGQRRYTGRMYLRNASRFDTYSQASEDTNREFAEKCDKYFPTAMVTNPTEEEIKATIKHANTAAKRLKIDTSNWPHFPATEAPAATLEERNETDQVLDTLLKAVKDNNQIQAVKDGLETKKSKAANLLGLLCQRLLDVDSNNYNADSMRQTLIEDYKDVLYKELGYDKLQNN